MRKKYIFGKKLYISILTSILVLLTTVATTFAWVGVFANSTFDQFDFNIKSSSLEEYGIEISLSGKENSFSDLERVFIVTENDRITWFCTFTQEDWIPNCDYSPFIWFIFVDKNYRWKRVSEKLINTVEEYAKTLNFEKLYIVSDHKGLYEKYWFEKCDEKTDELWRIETIFVREIK